MNSEEHLRKLEQKVYQREFLLNGALEDLSIFVSNILRHEVVADLCTGGTEIEFRVVSNSGFADSDSCIRMEDVISKLNQKDKR